MTGKALVAALPFDGLPSLAYLSVAELSREAKERLSSNSSFS
jgi:hypothetical protein